MIKVGNNIESLASQRKDAIRVDFEQVRELMTDQSTGGSPLKEIV